MFPSPSRWSMQIFSALPIPRSSKPFVPVQLPQHALSLMIQSLWQNIFRIQGLCHTLLVFCNNNINLFSFTEISSCYQILPSSARDQTSFFCSIHWTNFWEQTNSHNMNNIFVIDENQNTVFCEILQTTVMKITPETIFLRNTVIAL